MKRSVAIFGPTPQFVRWAIARECPLRMMDIDNLPDTTFRQLRGLRELSNGLIENRVLDDICVHPDSSSNDIAAARGFPTEEILQTFGDAEFVKSCCDNCPANAVSNQRDGIWAGCYGWLPANGNFQLEVTASSNSQNESLDSSRSVPETGKLDPAIDPCEHPDEKSLAKTTHLTGGDINGGLVATMDTAIQSLNIQSKIEEHFATTNPYWFGIWQTKILDCERAELLLQVFNQMLQQFENQPDSNRMHVLRFRDALTRAVKHGLSIHVDLLPPGNSDGKKWTLFSHCPNCKKVANDFDASNPREEKCSSCQRVGHPHGRQKNKVLGLRPYMHLVGILGEEKTLALIKRYEQR
ncbi:MAG: hypothetical protein AB8B55_23365 [Mariniblastus sp.]